MRHFILTIMLLMFSWCICNAQSEHIKFKGISIKGSVNAFVDSIKAKTPSYEVVQIFDGKGAIISGTFAGIDSCKICPVVKKNTNDVYKVMVIFPTYKSWNILMRKYYKLQQSLSKKYGTPTACIEDDVVCGEDSKFKYLYYKDSRFITCYENENGKIRLFISPENYYSGSIILTYSNKEEETIDAYEEAYNDI